MMSEAAIMRLTNNPALMITFARISGTMIRNAQPMILTGKTCQMNNGKQQEC
jgi:hypothetical protein